MGCVVLLSSIYQVTGLGLWLYPSTTSWSFLSTSRERMAEALC